MGRWPWYYLLSAYAVLPCILLLISFLPPDVQMRYCVLDLKHPAVVPMFLMHYTHSELPHLASNLSFYLLILSALFIIETSRMRLFWVSAAFLIALPLVLSIMSVEFLPYFGSPRWAEGFSGIAFAFFGYAIALMVIGSYERFLGTVQEGWSRLRGFLRVCVLLDIACVDAVLCMGLVILGITLGHIGPGNGLAHFSGYITGALAPVAIGAFWKRPDGLARMFFLLVLAGTIHLYILYGIRAATVIG